MCSQAPCNCCIVRLLDRQSTRMQAPSDQILNHDCCLLSPARCAFRPCCASSQPLCRCAGTETTASTMTFACWNLARCPDKAAKLQAELDKHPGGPAHTPAVRISVQFSVTAAKLQAELDTKRAPWWASPRMHGSRNAGWSSVLQGSMGAAALLHAQCMLQQARLGVAT